MTADLNSLYDIQVDLHGLDDLAKYGFFSHACVELTPTGGTDDGFSRAQVLDAWRWYAGVAARVASTLTVEINGEDLMGRDDHHAFGELAFTFASGLINLEKSFDNDEPPLVGVEIPGRLGTAEQWFGRAKELLAQVLTADQQPVPPALAPADNRDAAHGGPTPHEPSSRPTPPRGAANT